MSSCNDAAGVEMLSGPELAILNAVAKDAHYLTSLLQPPAEFEFAVGEPWHHLAPADGVAAIGRLASLGLVEVYGAYDMSLKRRYVPSAYNFKKIHVRLTPRGGACWERAWEVDWKRLVEDEGHDGADDAGDESVLLRFGSSEAVGELIDAARASRFAAQIDVVDMCPVDGYAWSSWKTLPRVWEVRVTMRPEMNWHRLQRVTGSVWSLYRRIALAFKRRNVPEPIDLR